jgi:hypothetical protein
MDPGDELARELLRDRLATMAARTVGFTVE